MKDRDHRSDFSHDSLSRRDRRDAEIAEIAEKDSHVRKQAAPALETSVVRRYSRRSWTMQTNFTSVLSPRVVNEARLAYLHGDPVTLWESQNPSTTYTRSGALGFTINESRASDLWSYQWQLRRPLELTRRSFLLPIVSI